MGDVSGFVSGSLPGDLGGAVGGETGEGTAVGGGALLADINRISASTSAVTLMDAKLTRIAGKIFNDSTDTLYVKYGPDASPTDFTVKMVAGAYFEMPLPVYLGQVTGVWSGTNGAAQVTEEY